eukprot:7459444-Karenia_brevis.AAC.1
MGKVATMIDKETSLLLDLEQTGYILKKDDSKFHRISAHYVCTDRFLNGYLAALIHPDTKGSYNRVLGHLRDRLGWQGYLLPTYRAIHHTLTENLLKHRVVTRMMAKCRGDADKRVVGIDG